jgi:hypothetical protein
MSPEDKEYFEQLLTKTVKENQVIGLQSGKKENSDLVFSIKEVFEQRLSEQTEHLIEIKEQVKKTNGRVTSLEETRTKIWTAIGLLTFLGGAIITLSIMAIDNKIQKGIATELSKYDVQVTR